MTWPELIIAYIAAIIFWNVAEYIIKKYKMRNKIKITLTHEDKLPHGLKICELIIPKGKLKISDSGDYEIQEFEITLCSEVEKI